MHRTKKLKKEYCRASHHLYGILSLPKIYRKMPLLSLRDYWNLILKNDGRLTRYLKIHGCKVSLPNPKRSLSVTNDLLPIVDTRPKLGLHFSNCYCHPPIDCTLARTIATVSQIQAGLPYLSLLFIDWIRKIVVTYQLENLIVIARMKMKTCVYLWMTFRRSCPNT